jgi:hypothetical protein
MNSGYAGCLMVSSGTPSIFRMTLTIILHPVSSPVSWRRTQFDASFGRLNWLLKNSARKQGRPGIDQFPLAAKQHLTRQFKGAAEKRRAHDEKHS